jgi:hypothetical protein
MEELKGDEVIKVSEGIWECTKKEGANGED